MEDKNQRERLEQELRFLKESFEAEVISKDEYEKGKDRIEKKLNELGTTPNNEEKAEEIKIEDAKKDEIIQDNKEEKAIPVQQETQKTEEEKPEEQKKENSLFKYAVVFVVLVLVIFFSYSLLKSSKSSQEKANEVKFVAACSSDADCKSDGKIGACLNPGTREAKCEFKAIQKTNVLVLNDKKSCFNCGTQRILSILEQWFGQLEIKEIEYYTEESKPIAKIAEIELLPAYILNENVTKQEAFEQFKRVFTKKNDYYILNEDAAGSTFYFMRENIPNKLDLFGIEGDAASLKAEKNLKEFLDNFPGVKFEKHLAKGELSKELNIKNFPTFLVNNRVKFSGIHTADTIKNNFCSLNKADACNKTLSRNLI